MFSCGCPWLLVLGGKAGLSGRMGWGGAGRVAVWARFRSVKNAAVLTTQRTRRKDRRFYTTLTENYAAPPAVSNSRGSPGSPAPKTETGWLATLYVLWLMR